MTSMNYRARIIGRKAIQDISRLKIRHRDRFPRVIKDLTIETFEEVIIYFQELKQYVDGQTSVSSAQMERISKELSKIKNDISNLKVK